MARPPLPTNIKVLKGTQKPSRVNHDEPMPDRGEPSIPAWLGDDARPYWPEIAAILDDLNVLTTADGIALALLCDALSEMVAARRFLKRHGRKYKSVTKNGMRWVEYPEVRQASDAWRRVEHMLGQFGMMPAARARLSVGKAEKPTDEMEALLDRRRA